MSNEHVDENDKQVTTEHYEDIWATVVYETSGEAYVNFRAYDWTALGQDEIWYERKNWQSSDDKTTDINEARTIIEGSIKFDGCGHWNFCKEDDGYVHLCGKHSIKQLTELMWKIYHRCGELMDYTIPGEFKEDK